ncbi:MAG: ComEC/Rec2 family competence protein [Anaerolineales bacterium]
MKTIEKTWSNFRERWGTLGVVLLVLVLLLLSCCVSTLAFGMVVLRTGSTATPIPTGTPVPIDTPTLTGTPIPTDTPTPTVETLEGLQVHVLDVSQGDAILILPPDDGAILIDGGNAGSEVVEYLLTQGVERLAMVVATHPHADHIGGLVDVLEAMPVEEVVTNGHPHTTQTYERFLDAIASARAIYTEVGRGDTLQVGNLTLDVLHPPGDFAGEGLNNNSLVLRLVHGDVVFLFLGDAEREAEESMIASGRDLGATVLKVGHHGSRTSSSPMFLERVQPEVAIYCCGLDNRYGHPHAETLAALADVGAEVYGTDVNGTVTITSDGTNYIVDVARQGQPRAPTE